jgi:hypothetical protein
VVLGGFVKGWGGEFTPTSFSQSIWRELATKIRFEVSLTAVFNPSRHTFYPSTRTTIFIRRENNLLWTFEFATNWHHLKLCINQCVLIPAVSCRVYFVCPVSRQIVLLDDDDAIMIFVRETVSWIISVECRPFCSTCFVTQFPWQRLQTDRLFLSRK